MAIDTITIKISVAWWVRWYLKGVAFVSFAMGMTPDMDKVGRVVMRGAV